MCDVIKVLGPLDTHIKGKPLYLTAAVSRNSKSALDEKTIIDSLLYYRLLDDKKSPADFEKEILGSW